MLYKDLLNIQEEVVLSPQEQIRIFDPARNELAIGVPKERTSEERRVSLTPPAIRTLVQRGHKVFVERGAGADSHYSDDEYASAGAFIVYSPDELFNKSTLIVKVLPLTEEECSLIKPNQVVISALNLGTLRKNYFRTLIDKQVTGIAFEYIEDQARELPVVRVLSEIAGMMSIQIAARYLESDKKGRGILLGAIAGIPPATVVILGAGTVGESAARSALGAGAQVMILDRDLGRLREVDQRLDRRVVTAISNMHFLNKVVRFADVLIGAIAVRGQKNPYIITEDMVKAMKPGSVILDISIDQGGCIETSRPTSMSNPVFVKHGITHFCVPNINSFVARTSSTALTNALLPFLLDIGDQPDMNTALWKNLPLRNGTYVYRGYCTKTSLTDLFSVPFRDIELLLSE
ncbi:MAG: alanine dehydrogenase [Bacteroidetes bacterium]|nr:alanine dehydrogenase [Bacteroidota bacterium]